MSASSVSDPGRKVPLDKYGYGTVIRHMSMVLITCGPLFLVAGSWSWTWAWVYAAASLIGWTALNLVVTAENPALFNRRGRPAHDVMTGAKQWDLIILPIYSILLLAVPIVAGLDFRYGWSGVSAPVIHDVGLALFLLGFIPLTWAMAANKFFEPAVRVQIPGGHQVVANGPYRFVRHPGYAGVILHFIAVPLMLGTWAALVPALLGAALYGVPRLQLTQSRQQQSQPVIRKVLLAYRQSRYRFQRRLRLFHPVAHRHLAMVALAQNMRQPDRRNPPPTQFLLRQSVPPQVAIQQFRKFDALHYFKQKHHVVDSFGGYGKLCVHSLSLPTNSTFRHIVPANEQCLFHFAMTEWRSADAVRQSSRPCTQASDVGFPDRNPHRSAIPDNRPLPPIVLG